MAILLGIYPIFRQTHVLEGFSELQFNVWLANRHEATQRVTEHEFYPGRVPPA